MTSGNIRRASLQEIRAMNERGALPTNHTPADGEELGPDFWADAKIVEPRQGRSVHLKIDADVFDFFKAQGKGHLTRMQRVLRAYVDAHRRG